MGKLQDKKLFEQATAGRNKDAFGKLFTRWYAPLVSYACRFVDQGDAENVVQDVMLYVWEKGEHICLQNEVSTYLYSAVYKRCASLVTRGEIRSKVMTNLKFSMLSNFTVESQSKMDYEQMYVRFKHTLGEIPEVQRRAFEMSRFEDLSYKEIAEIQGVSAKTVEYRISKVLEALRKSLKTYMST